MLRVPARHVRYPNLYTWLVFVSALDLLFTYLVLFIGGFEANSLAATVMHRWGFDGMIVYKFSLVLLIVILCELIGRRDSNWGRRLGVIGIVLTCVPIGIAAILLTARVRHLI